MGAQELIILWNGNISQRGFIVELVESSVNLIKTPYQTPRATLIELGVVWSKYRDTSLQFELQIKKHAKHTRFYK